MKKAAAPSAFFKVFYSLITHYIMPALSILDLTKDITPEEIATRKKIEGLINLSKGLQHDRESVFEAVGEIIEQRREEIIDLDLNPVILDAGLTALQGVFSEMEAHVHRAQIAAIREQRN